ncbi:hypothetical protein ACR3GP_004097 [Yersinia enterocolitica]|nr:hypothetical protein [Yersinia enterocolitica]EKN4117516.1 hypothetical protein [Yersinia enterocolitica]HED4486938.1 hypothetical protein [Yersinia enterocolitica]HEI6919774.1 hypothetical protein [Yersinia enterocolitica]
MSLCEVRSDDSVETSEAENWAGGCGGAIAITIAVLGAVTGKYSPYKGVAGVLTVCDGHTG